MGSFLDNLKKSVESGEKNEEIVKQLDAIGKGAATVNIDEISDKYEKNLDKLEPADPKVAEEYNASYNAKMDAIRKNDAAVKLIGNIMSMDDDVVNSIRDMLSFIDQIYPTIPKDIEMYDELIGKIDEIRSRYIPVE